MSSMRVVSCLPLLLWYVPYPFYPFFPLVQHVIYVCLTSKCIRWVIYVLHVIYVCFTHTRIPQSQFLENHLQNIFGKYFLFLKIVYQDIVKAFFERNALEANANFNAFESKCPKIRIFLNALKAKLSKCPQRSHQSVDASGLLDHLS